MGGGSWILSIFLTRGPAKTKSIVSQILQYSAIFNSIVFCQKQGKPMRGKHCLFFNVKFRQIRLKLQNYPCKTNNFIVYNV